MRKKKGKDRLWKEKQKNKEGRLKSNIDWNRRKLNSRDSWIYKDRKN